MREIKFRAWDYTSNVMRTDISNVRYNEDGSINQIDVYSGSDILFPDKECVLMQYTGLKDKNSVEIYEGDILKTNLGLPGIFPGRESYMYFSIEFEPGRFVVQSAVTKDRPDIADVLKLAPCEVIGNIYQNPELLK